MRGLCSMPLPFPPSTVLLDWYILLLFFFSFHIHDIPFLTKTGSGVMSMYNNFILDVTGEYAGTQGLGLLRLHSTYRHDLKIYASDEGRVQMTAAAFAKGLLALEGELTPILVQMVKSANTNGLLDNDCDSYKHQNM